MKYVEINKMRGYKRIFPLFQVIEAIKSTNRIKKVRFPCPRPTSINVWMWNVDIIKIWT